jgi:hypothetical protein
MLSNNEKIEFLKLKLDFYKDRLQESLSCVDHLEESNNQLKIEINESDIIKYENYIINLENEIKYLTNQI